VVVHACNLSYVGRRDGRSWGKSEPDPVSKKQAQCGTSIISAKLIPARQEAEIESRSKFSSRQKRSGRPYLKNKGKQKGLK
jgi:hypothetical protein